MQGKELERGPEVPSNLAWLRLGQHVRTCGGRQDPYPQGPWVRHVVDEEQHMIILAFRKDACDSPVEKDSETGGGGARADGGYQGPLSCTAGVSIKGSFCTQAMAEAG